jgi:hypothetical protein
MLAGRPATSASVAEMTLPACVPSTRVFWVAWVFVGVMDLVVVARVERGIERIIACGADAFDLWSTRVSVTSRAAQSAQKTWRA